MIFKIELGFSMQVNQFFERKKDFDSYQIKKSIEQFSWSKSTWS